MKIHLYQIIVVAISAVMLFQGVKNFVNREAGQTFLKLFVRIIVWGGMSLIAVLPESTFYLAHIIGIEGNITAVMVTGFIFVFLILFKLLSAIEKIEQNVSELTRSEALKEANERIDKLRDEAEKSREN